MLSEVSKLVGGKQGVCLESVETCLLTSVWFWIVKGAARMARLALSFSTFQGFQNILSDVNIRNMKIEDFQRAVRMYTATDRCGSGLFVSESAC